MSVQNVSLSAMFAWFPESLRLLKSGSRRFVSASLWTVLIIVVPAIAFMGVVFATGAFDPASPTPFGPNTVWIWLGYGALLIVSLIVQPAIVVGWLAMCGDVDVGRHGRGRDIFAPFRQPSLWRRGLVVVLVTMVVVGLLFCVTVLPFIPSLLAYEQAIAAQAVALGSSAPPPAPPFALFGLMLGYLVFLVPALLAQLVSFVALGEIAARPTPPLAALLLATRAVWRNLLKLIVFGIVLYVAMNVVMMIVIIPMVLVGIGLAFINPILAGVVIGVLYLALIVAMYPVMFVFAYLLWKGLLAGNTPPGTPSSIGA
jgi:hypothetical protein